MCNTKLLRTELWELMHGGDIDRISEMVKLPKQSERMGEIEDCLRSAVRRSSVGMFGGDIYFYGGRLYEKVSWDEWRTVLTDLLYDNVRVPKVDYGTVYYVVNRTTVLARSKHLELMHNLMVFRNGVLDTETMKFYKRFDRKFVQLWGVDYDYNPDARTFVWYQFINQVLPNKDMQEVLQMFLGATFVDRRKVRIEHLLILLGRGANGKGVVNQVIKGVLGDNMSAEGIGNLCAKGLEGMSALARINGKRLNFGTEMSVSDFRRRDARLKTLISGEPTTARMLYGQPFEARDIPLLMSSANMIPAFDVDDDALLRRIYPIPFDVVIPPEKRNPELANELEAEYPGIFNWVMDGRQKFVENGYRLPERNMLKELVYKKVVEYDTSLQFMKKKGFRPKMDGVDMAPRNFVRVKDLYDEYVRWTRNNDIHTEGKTTFLKSLEKAGYVKARHSNGLVIWVFGDITLRTLRNEADKVRDRQLKEKAPDASILTLDGETWITSMSALGAYVGASLRAVEKVNREGGFEGCTKSWKMRTLYNIEKCREVLKKRLVIVSDEVKEKHRAMAEQLRVMRNKFNVKMKYHKLPYRKYAKEDQIDENITVVPDEMTVREAFDLAKKEYGYVNKNIKIHDDYE